MILHPNCAQARELVQNLAEPGHGAQALNITEKRAGDSQ